MRPLSRLEAAEIAIVASNGEVSRHNRGHFKWRLNLRVFKTVGLQARRSPCQLRRTVPAWRAFAKDVHSDLVPAPDFDTFLSRQLGSMRLVRILQSGHA